MNISNLLFDENYKFNYLKLDSSKKEVVPASANFSLKVKKASARQESIRALNELSETLGDFGKAQKTLANQSMKKISILSNNLMHLRDKFDKEGFTEEVQSLAKIETTIATVIKQKEKKECSYADCPDELRAEIEPFLLPNNHPAKLKLDQILKNCSVISVKEMEEAGFIKFASGQEIQVMCSEELPEYVIKVPQPPGNRDPSPKETVYRVHAHKQAIEKIVTPENMTFISATKNWLYPIPKFDREEINELKDFYADKKKLKQNLSAKDYVKQKYHAQRIFKKRFLVIEEKEEKLSRFRLPPSCPSLLEIIHEHASFLFLSGEGDGHDKNVQLAPSKGKILFVDLSKWEKNAEKRENNAIYALAKDHIMAIDHEEAWKAELTLIKTKLVYQSSKEIWTDRITGRFGV